MYSNLNILIVEDSGLVARGLEHRLRQQGYERIRLAANSAECLHILAEAPVDVILMDIELKGSEADGIETARAVRDLYDVPVIFLTAFADEDTLARAGSAGAVNYLVKPVNDRQLHVAIQQALGERHPVMDQSALTTPSRPGRHEAIYVKGKEKYYERIEIADIICLEAENNGVILHTLQGRHFTYNTLQSILAILRDHPFVRIHKSAAVHVDHVVAKSESELVLRNGTTHVVGKAFRDAVDGRFQVVRPKS
jgi:DNA-binding LytR/AlgR family response regulator